MTRVLVELGYDGLEILKDRFTLAVGGNQIVVFDPRRVVVIDDNTERSSGSRTPDG